MFQEGNTTRGDATDRDADKVEQLRLILQNEQSHLVTYEEAADIGESLISFFEVLADDSFAEQQTLIKATV